MQVRSNYNPAPYEIEVVDKTAVLHFYENIVEVDEPDTEDGQGRKEWEFDKYTIARPYDSGLVARVTRDIPGWLAMAKREEFDRLDSEIKAVRAKLFAEVDWTALSDAPLSPEKSAEYRAYRQALRDVDKKHVPTYPYGITWPEKPAKEDV